MIDRHAFFGRVREQVFGGSLTQTQVAGINAIIDEWFSRPNLTDTRQLAYILATPMIETGGRFEPIVESLNYSVDGLKSQFSRSRISAADCERLGRKKGRPAQQEEIGNIIYGGEFGRANLGNTEPGDGYRFRGRGLSQITGRRLYQWASEVERMDFLANPDAFTTDIRYSAAAIVVGMTEGIFTGRELSDYIDGEKCDFVNARRTVNALDRAAGIAAFAVEFNDALAFAQVNAAPSPPARPPVQAPPPPPPDVEPSTPSEPATGFWAWLLRLLKIGA